MKLGIIGAMDVEIKTIIESMVSPVMIQYAGMDFCEGQLNGFQFLAIMHKAAINICIQVFVQTYVFFSQG